MTTEEALKFAEANLNTPYPTDLTQFSKWADDAQHAVKERKALHAPTALKAWALKWRAIRDSFDRLVAADPPLLYRPANRMSQEMHDSFAFVRMACCANRTSKTWTIDMIAGGEMTGRSWGKRLAGPHPCDIFAIGVDFQKYAPNVFEKKFLVGEPGVVFSPIFPENGKWFRKYDDKKKRLELGCAQCAEQGKAKECPHIGSTITLFSDNEGHRVLQGGAYRGGIFDEEIDEEFWPEGLQRTQTVKDPFILIGFTPESGPDHWSHKIVASVAKGDARFNHVDIGNLNSRQFATYHTIGQEEGGLVPKEQIAVSRRTMDEAEASARLDGIPVPIVKKPVFNRQKISEMMKCAVGPEWRGGLNAVGDVELSQLTMESKFEKAIDSEGLLRVWRDPLPGMLYLASVDCAIGLSGGDPSCCSIFSVTPGLKGTKLDLCAQLHGWINSFDYAAEVMKLAVWYNSALVVIENSGGYGEAVALKLREFCYWNLYVDEQDRTKTDPTLEKRVGVNTNVVSKPFMVSATQKMLVDGLLDIPCGDTLQEMMAFEQDRAKLGTTTRYRGGAGTHDDRCMSVVIACGVAVSYPTFKWQTLKDIAESMQQEDNISPEWREILEERREQVEYEYN